MSKNGQLKIAMLSAHSCPVGRLGAKDTGGMSVYVLELARELGKQGHLVDIYTRVHDPQDKLIYELGTNARLIHLKAGEDGEINKLDVYPHLPEFVCQLEDFRKRNQLQYDLIYSHYWLSARAGESLQSRWNVPHMIMFHTLGAIKNTLGVGEPEPELRIDMEREVSHNCHRIIAATEKEKEAIIRYYGASPETISVIPCGVNMELFRPIEKKEAKQQLGFGNNGKNILFVGRLEPLKGIDKLLRAMTYLEDGRNVELWIIGGDEQSQHELERLQELTQELRIQNSVSFLGLIKQPELPLYYSAADVCVVPSYYESFGLVALESLACGTPVVTTRVGNMENIICQGETGYVLDDNAPGGLADKIALLLSRSRNGIGSVNLIRESVAGFSWTSIAEKIAEECRTAVVEYSARNTSLLASRSSNSLPIP